MMQQKAMRYWSEGIECAGTLYLPDTLMPAHKAPAVVLGHGTTYVKEMHLPHFARTFVDAGLIVLACCLKHAHSTTWYGLAGHWFEQSTPVWKAWREFAENIPVRPHSFAFSNSFTSRTRS